MSSQKWPLINKSVFRTDSADVVHGRPRTYSRFNLSVSAFVLEHTPTCFNLSIVFIAFSVNVVWLQMALTLIERHQAADTRRYTQKKTIVRGEQYFDTGVSNYKLKA